MSNTIYSKFFLKNKYTKYYFLIINNSKNRTKQYSEKHHIIPKSFGGTDDSENLVDLTPREHFICHMLLTKIGINHVTISREINFYKKEKAVI